MIDDGTAIVMVLVESPGVGKLVRLCAAAVEGVGNTRRLGGRLQLIRLFFFPSSSEAGFGMNDERMPAGKELFTLLMV